MDQGLRNVSSTQPQAPKHRASKARLAPRAALKTSLTLSSMAVVATGFAVGSGSLSLGAHGGPDSSSTSVADLGAAAADTGLSSGSSTGSAGSTDLSSARADAAAAAAVADRAEQPVTRSDNRAKADPLKKDTLSLGSGNTMSRTEDLSDEDPKSIARALLSSFGWDESQFGCLDSLWERESHWNPSAENSSSGAYGIPQSLPGSKMASVAADWRTNPVTQIKWGLGYIQDRYGSPCGAWGHSESNGWY
jgi:hypothetical protein